MKDINDIRRLRVAALHLRGITPIEIQAALQQAGIPGDLETICQDIAFLQSVWNTETTSNQRAKAQLLAELRELRRAAWAAGGLAEVVNGLKLEAELLRLKSI